MSSPNGNNRKRDKKSASKSKKSPAISAQELERQIEDEINRIINATSWFDSQLTILTTMLTEVCKRAWTLACHLVVVCCCHNKIYPDLASAQADHS